VNVLDLFCGCGGLSLGFQNAGFNIVAAYDNWDNAIDIYNTNFTHKAITLDLSDKQYDFFSKHKADLIIGGPPCQDFSAAGKRIETIARASLTFKFAEIVCGLKPKWFVMENVERIVSSFALEQAVNLFRNNNYGLTQVVIDASRCGVPQKRKRFFLFGELFGNDDFIKDDIINNLSDCSTTIRDYMGDELDTEYFYRHPRSYARRGIFSIDEPSPTIRGVNRPIPKTYNFHKGDAIKDFNLVRPLTTNERARIQTFPKDFILFGNKTDLEQMIGNAVPVKMAEYVANILYKYIMIGREQYNSNYYQLRNGQLKLY